MRSVEIALKRWKTAWDVQMTSLTSEELEKFGFTRHASIEFWQLASILVEEGRTQIDTDRLSTANVDALNPVQTLLQDMGKRKA